MVLEVVIYGTPVLRQKGVKVQTIGSEMLALIQNMKETMYAAKGVGLAAQQIGQALQLAVIDVEGVTDRPSWMEIDGKKVELEKFMPLVLINPAVNAVGEPVSGPEGCLSFPEIYTEIKRPESVDVSSLQPDGSVLLFRCGGLLARAVQHEVDHLNGILFIDRMARENKDEFKAELEEMQIETKAKLKKAKK